MDKFLSISNSFHDIPLKNASVFLKNFHTHSHPTKRDFLIFPNSPKYIDFHCVKGVHIRSFSGAYFSAFRLNTEIYSVPLCSQSKSEKIRTRKSPNT